MNWKKWSIGLLVLLGMLYFNQTKAQQDTSMLIRMAEIEIYPEFEKEYKEILRIEAEASVRLEPGVLAIFPMYSKEKPTQIRILEIYLDDAAYKEHLKTAHFLTYKNSTLKMVKSLKLIDMNLIDPDSLSEIFRKVKPLKN